MISLLQQAATTAAGETPATATPVAPVATTTETGAVVPHGGMEGMAAHGVEPVVAHGTEMAHGADAAAHGATGLPQLDFATFPNQIFWLVVTLVVLFWIISRIAIPRISAVLADRQGAITGDLMAAEEFKRRARDAEAAYDRALAEARGEANKIVAANKAEIQRELDGAIAHADAEIAARASESERRIGDIRASAETDARTVAREVTAELVRSFGGQADAAAIDRAVDARLGRNVA